VLALGLCFIHDPDRAADRAAASARGGRGKARLARVERLVPGTLRPVLTLLLDVLADARDGTIAPAQAHAIAAIAGALEERLAELEEQISTLTRRGA